MRSGDQSPAAQAVRTIVRGDVRPDEPLRRHTTWRIGGAAEVFVSPVDIADLEALIEFGRRSGFPLHVLGFGSNVLVPDEGVRGIVVCLRRAADWVRFDVAEVSVGAGFSLPKLVWLCARKGLAGLEGLAGVPGSIGGALCMNAGTPQASIGDVTLEVLAVAREGGGRERLPAAAMGFGYRTSRLQRGDLIALSARLRLRPGDRAQLEQAVRDANRRRRETQPLEYPSAGSVFKNPPGDHAGRLIEAAGCKGLTYGRAQVSERHANFIINMGGATAMEVLRLMAVVHRRVGDAFGVRLEPEVRLLGGSQEDLMHYLEEFQDAEIHRHRRKSPGGTDQDQRG